MRAGTSPLTTVPRPAENGEPQVMAPLLRHDAEQDITGLGLDLPCTQDPELFFAESPQDVEQAKAMCRGCRARLVCLAGALERREPWGVWGGELLLRGNVVPGKRPRGRPRKDAARLGWLFRVHAATLGAPGALGDDHALGGGNGASEFELGQRGGALEQPRAAAQGQRANQQRIAVDQAGGVQASRRRCTAGPSRRG